MGGWGTMTLRPATFLPAVPGVCAPLRDGMGFRFQSSSCCWLTGCGGACLTDRKMWNFKSKNHRFTILPTFNEIFKLESQWY